MDNKTFNIILAGVGGQGIITLISVLDQAAFIDGYDIRSSELHGLSQRGGSVLAHIRFGKKVYSPLVENGMADLIIGLELTEGLRSASFASKDTKFLVNKHFIPYLNGMPKDEVLKNLNSKNLFLVEASDICKAKLEKEVLSGIYLIGYACKNNLLPIKKESFIKAIETIIPQKYLDINRKVFELAYHD
jgi:indolepyruvate ferredoxin oxidoreductase, beta subunit